MNNSKHKEKQDYYSLEEALQELQMKEDELKHLVAKGDIQAFPEQSKIRFKKADIHKLKKVRK